MEDKLTSREKWQLALAVGLVILALVLWGKEMFLR